MTVPSGLQRKGHFLGSKIRTLRKRSGLTLEELSIRCAQLDPEAAPSVSYLSLIETGRRMPSERLLGLLAEFFGRDLEWFLDDNLDSDPAPQKAPAGGLERMTLEPGFLFSKQLLESAIPELLSQTGTTGRQFAHLLIRNYQEMHQNRFPDLERAAEEVGGKRFPIDVDDLLDLYRQHGLKIRWFDREPVVTTDDSGRKVETLVRSFYVSPDTVYVNRCLEAQPPRLKYELAMQLGHKVLHDGDGLRSSHASGGELGGSPEPDSPRAATVVPEDILLAWRDFECSFFAGALLCPKLPFRRFLISEAHDVYAGERIGLTPAVVMRRMTSVSPYRHWHFFDAYPPGALRAVYRGNGIPLPWGNMRLVTDPCPQWAVFRMLGRPQVRKPMSQISVLQDQDGVRAYACLCVRTTDAAGSAHVLSVGVDLGPALESYGVDADGMVDTIAAACHKRGGSAPVPADAAESIAAVSRVLNIGWIADGLESPASLICPRSTQCPRPESCCRGSRRSPWLSEITEQIVQESNTARAGS